MNIKTGTLTKNLLAFSVLMSIFSMNSFADNSSLEPLYSKSGQVYSDITIDAALGYYNGRELEEIKDIDAYEVLMDITVPVFDNTQLRFTWPAYTDGSGTLKNNGDIHDGQSTDIKGNGGTYEFMTLSLEYQLKSAADQDYNLLVYGGFGGRATWLETTYDDNLNHNGSLVKFGARYDRSLTSDSKVFATLEYRYYWDTDDINPANDNGTSFNIINLSGAWVWQSSAALSPVVELMYSTDVKSYHALSVVPEVIYTINPAVDIKLGAPIGISSDADTYGVRLGVTTRF